MGPITNILFPVDFSPSCVAMAPYVKRATTLFNAKMSMIHVFDPASYNGFELYARRESEIAAEHQEVAREKLNSFLEAEFPASQHPRIVVAGDAATQIARAARNGFDLIIMPTHAGIFRRMLLGSTTAKVLNDSDCPVVTSRHVETIAPRPLEHREWLCAVGLDDDAERLLRYAHQAAAKARGNLHIIHAIQGGDVDGPIQVDLGDQIQSEEKQRVRQRIADLQQRAGSQAPVLVVVGPIKEALLEGARRFDADALMIGRSPQSGVHGRIRDLTYTVVRESPFPVLSV
jgi:nucleotide-binding universal stress UspA family protein